MSNFDSYEDIVQDVLDRMDEPTDLTGSDVSDWLDTVKRSVVRGFHHFHNAHPWPWTTKNPPGAFLTVAPVTDRTITVAAAGTSVAGTFSSAISTSCAGRKVIPTGKNYSFRITAHTAGAVDFTADAVPEALSAQACVVAQDEYDLASDLGLFIDGIWSSDGQFVEQIGQQRLKQEYPDPPNQGWPARYFTRLTMTRIRFSSYPDAVRRMEYPYSYIPSDPSGSSDLIIPQNFRWLLSDAGLYFGYLLKSDKRAETAKQGYEGAVGQCMSYAHRLVMSLSTHAGAATRGPFQ